MNKVLRKLDVTSRRQLTGALAGSRPGDPGPDGGAQWDGAPVPPAAPGGPQGLGSFLDAGRRSGWSP